MYQIKSLKIKGLFTYVEETTVNMTSGLSYIIYGENNDEIGSESNGSGKSALLECICIAISGASYRDISKEEIINDNLKLGYLSLELHNPILKTTILIERFFERKKKEISTLSVNNVEQTQITSINELNKTIFELLGINQEEFFNFFIIGEFAGKPFLNSSDGEKKDIIYNLSKANILQKAQFSLETESNDTVELLDEIEQNIQIEEELKNALEQQYETEVEESQKRNNNEVIEIKKDIAENDDYIKKLEDNNVIILKNTKTNSIKIDKFEPIKKQYAEQIDILSEKQTELKDIKSKRRIVNETIELLENKLKHVIVCPKCSHNFLNSKAKEDVNSINKEIETNKKQNKSFDEQIKAKDVEIGIIEDKCVSLSNSLVDLKHLKDNDNEYKRKLSTNLALIVEKENQNKRLNQKLIDKKQQPINNTLSDLKLKITEHTENVEQLRQMLPEAEQQKELFDFWKFHFSKKGLGTFMVNKVLSIIEGAINNKLKKFNVHSVVKLNGFTKLKGGELREKIDVLVSKDSVLFSNYKKLSAGERARLNIASVFALHSMINENITPKGLDFLGIDESFDKGLDRIGQKFCLDLLEESKISTWLISHMNNDIGAKNKIIVSKTNGCTTIKEIQ